MDVDGAALTRRRRRLDATLLVAALPLAFIGLLFLYPVATIVWTGLAPDGRVDLSPLADVVADPAILRVVWFTLWQATVSTALTLLVGLPGAYVLARYDFPGRRLLRAAVTVPFVLPTVVVASAFLSLLGPRSPFGNLTLHDSVWAILLAHAFFNYAVVVRTVGGLWAHLDVRTEEAAQVLGAGRVRTFLEVTLPRLRPAISAAAAIVFLFTFTSFGVVLILGGPGRATIEVEIHRYTAQLLDLPTASALALLQLVFVVAALVVYGRLQRRPRAGERLRSAGDVARPPRGVGQRLVLAANLLVMLVLLALPLAVLVERSLSTGDGYGLSLYRTLGEARRGSILAVTPWEAVRNSIGFGVVAATVAITVGGAAAWVVTRSRSRAAKVLDGLLMLPLGISAVTVGFGFLISLDTPPLDLRASPVLVPLAQAVVATPFVVRILVPVLGAIDDRLREAAAVLGAPPRRIWREVDLPIVGRALLVAGGFAFAISVGEFGATIFLARANLPTLPIAIFRLLGQPGAANFGQAMAMSTILMAVTASVIVAVERVRVGTVGEFWVLSIRDLTVSYGPTVAVAGVDLEVARGEVVAVLGPSGCGKSTLLRAVAGLERPDAGTITLDGRDLAGLRPDERGLGMMFQDGALFPHRDVRGNVAFGLRMRGWPARRSTERVDEVLELVGLHGLGHRDVSTLSGGEQQRVALARAVAPGPDLLMLDEPLGSLDRGLRDRLVVELRTLFGELGSTVLYVTHDQDEALALADRVAVMRAGEVVQAAPPDVLWRRPDTAFVARFLGQHNLVPARIEDGRAVTVLGDVPARGATADTAGDEVSVLYLPDALQLAEDGHGGVVTARRFAGDHVVVTVAFEAGPELDVACWGGDAPAVGAEVAVAVDPQRTWVVAAG